MGARVSTPDQNLLGLSAEGWTAVATVIMAVATIVSAWVAIVVMRSQDRLIEIQTVLTELQRRANWLNGALESHSELMLRLKAEEMGKSVVWWDPTNEGPEKKRPPGDRRHKHPVTTEPVYIYLPEDLRRYPDIR
jgi:hypothetical protein